jgi:hypothetical protein
MTPLQAWEAARSTTVSGIRASFSAVPVAAPDLDHARVLHAKTAVAVWARRLLESTAWAPRRWL